MRQGTKRELHETLGKGRSRCSDRGCAVDPFLLYPFGISRRRRSHKCSCVGAAAAALAPGRVSDAFMLWICKTVLQKVLLRQTQYRQPGFLLGRRCRCVFGGFSLS